MHLSPCALEVSSGSRSSRNSRKPWDTSLDVLEAAIADDMRKNKLDRELLTLSSWSSLKLIPASA